jgi:hypothetical protein
MEWLFVLAPAAFLGLLVYGSLIYPEKCRRDMFVALLETYQLELKVGVEKSKMAPLINEFGDGLK